MYRGMQVKLVQSDLECTVSIEGKDFKANKHDERGIVGWMGYPCYLMFESPEKYARALVDDWDIIGNEKILAPPVHDDSHSHDNH